MSIIAPFCGELLPIHNPLFGCLQPSAMPQSPPSTATSLALPSKREKSRLSHLGGGHHDLVNSWRTMVNTVPRATVAVRPALAEVQPNLKTGNSSTNSRLTSKPSTGVSLSHSIPRPAASPDVFAPSHNPGLPCQPTTVSKQTGKRLLESLNASLSATKRTKVEDKRGLAEATAAKNHKLEEEKWRAKWIKVFPTLIFHFEIGSEEGQGKSLAGRVAKMGAVRS